MARVVGKDDTDVALMNSRPFQSCNLCQCRPLESMFVRRFWNDGRRVTGRGSFRVPVGAYAPIIAGFQTRKALRRRHQIVSTSPCVLQKVVRHGGTDNVITTIALLVLAKSRTIPSSARLQRAYLQFGIVYVLHVSCLLLFFWRSVSPDSPDLIDDVLDKCRVRR